MSSIEHELRKTRIRLEAKHAQEKLSRSEERFRQMAEHIEEVFWMTNPDKNEILYVSRYPKVWDEFLRFKATGVASVFENPIFNSDKIVLLLYESLAESQCVLETMPSWEPPKRHLRVALELLAHKEYLSPSLHVGKSSAAVPSNRITWPSRSLPCWRR